MSNRIKLFVAAITIAVFGALTSPASAAPPKISLWIGHPYIPVGTVGYSWYYECSGLYHSGADAVLKYKAWSPAGISGYDVTWDDSHGGWTTHYATNVTQHWFADNYASDCGGPWPWEWTVTAYSKSGASITRAEHDSIEVVRWNNTSTGFVGERGKWTFSAGWKKTKNAGADGGSLNGTTVRGASGTFVAHVYSTGEHRDLEMATGPRHGRAAIYVDGKYRTTIDSNAKVNGSQVYLWDSGALAKGTHTIKVVNLATSGRPRIDINAMSGLWANL
jgi:hypothetical protein